MKNINIDSSSFKNSYNIPKESYKYKWSFNKKKSDGYNKFDIFVILCIFTIAAFLIF
jgi:hypothetical protein